MKANLLKLFSTFGLALFLSWAYLFTPQTFFSLDNRLRDFMFVLRGELPKNDTIVIVDIDDASLKAYGQWPWSRDLVSQLLENINALQPGIIGLDIVFSEADRASPHLLSQKFENLPKTLPNNDATLAKTFQTAPIVGGYIFTFDKTKTQNEAPIIPAIIIQKGLKDNHSLLTPSSTILNIPILQESLYSSGFFNNIPDANGMIRTVPLIMKYDYTLYTSLALEMVRIYSNVNKITVQGDAFGIESMDFESYHIPIDNFGRLFINFRGPKHHYTYISAKDILTHKIPTNALKDKFVLVGTSALGLYDLRAIPFDSNIPGVEIHANVIDNLLTKDFLAQPRNKVLYNLSILWTLIIALMLLWHNLRSWLILPVALLVLYGLGTLFFTLLFSYGLVLNLLFPLLAFFLTLISSVAIDYMVSFRQKEEAKKILGKKVSTSVMNHLIKHASEELVNPKEVEATVFFSDIQGFTSISETLGSPAKLIEMLNTYMTPMVESVIQHQGTIDKFIGDAIMAYWNAPLEVPEHADKAVQSAIAQIESLSQINAVITARYNVTINIGIGLHTGLVTAGDMGAKGRSDYTVIGDNVNLASRLEGLTRHYDVQILISEATKQALTGTYNIRPIDTVAVKGKSNAVKIYEVICNTKNIGTEESILYLDAFKAYQNAQLTEAKNAFEILCELYPCTLYIQYLKRCKEALEDTEKTFSPILKMTTK
ncbi:MAG TPA: adenylate/guanylate cyclase domain-containing protein [Epsilonproteobacteria bacterium]|nr:adenylate/guanylate cyclase domain-containing protein [Campylobacterota bacterium]